MKWVRGWMASAAAVLLAGSHGFGLAAKANTPADRAWAEAAKSDTLEGYAAFAIAHPESEHAAVAYAKLSSPEQRLRGDEGAPREMSGQETTNRDFWVRGRTGLKYGPWTVGPEAIMLGNVSFDEARFGGFVTYDLTNYMSVQANLGYADAIRNDNSGRGGNGVYGGVTLVFVH